MKKKTIGITGGIGSGKSLISHVIKLLGYPVYDSDKRAKERMENDVEIRSQLIKHFGENSFTDGKLNRSYLAQRIFENTSDRQIIEQIVHPVVRQDFRQWTEQQTQSIVFQESALLFETEGFRLLDAVILVTAPEKIRIQRVAKRDQTSEDKVRKRMETQMPDSEKEQLTRLQIDNGGEKLVIPQVLKILEEIKADQRISS